MYAFQPADFKPFVAVDLLEVYNESGDYEDGGEVLDINDEGMAVGWVDDGTYRMPFYFNPSEFDPVNGSLTILDATDGEDDYDYVVATAISEPDATSGDIIIVGYAKVNYSDSDSYPCMWIITSTPGDIDFFSGTDYVGIASEANIEAGSSGKVVGQVYDSTEGKDVAYVYDIYNSTTTKLTPAAIGAARAIDDNGNIFGWYVNGSDKSVACAWASPSHTRVDIHTTANHYSQAYAVNSDLDVVGWYWFTSSSQGAAYWEYDSQSEDWTGSLIGPPPLTSPPLNSAFDFNSDGAVIISADDDSSSDGVWLYYDTSTTGKDDLNDLNDLVLFPPSDAPIMYRAYAINEGWWIGGSYKPDENAGDVRPVLLIPYDTDNDGDPDIREILDGTEVDTDDNNWLLDDSEEMRVGLHAPGDADDPEGLIDDVYVVRRRISLKARGSTPDEAIEEIDEWVDEIVDPECTPCLSLVEWVSEWGYGHDCEIIVRVHSLMNADGVEWGDYEALPEDDPDRFDAIEDLQIFGYRFAACIDYLQWGNESFAGSGGYKFRNSDLSCTITDGTLFQDLPNNCKVEAVDEVVAWQEDQMWAALQGSALAGRPLRMCSTGMLEKHVNDGYDDDESLAYYIVSETIDMCNRNQMYTALHVHYKTVADATDMIQQLTSSVPEETAPWDRPNWTVATEVGITADFGDGWWDPPNDGHFYDYFFQDEPGVHPFYEVFVDDYISDVGQYNETDGPDLAGVFELLDSTGFTAVCYSALQYDKGTYNNPSKYLIEALRGTKVREDGMFDVGNGVNRFTPLKDEYEDVAYVYYIDSFNPHTCACNEDIACPGC